MKIGVYGNLTLDELERNGRRFLSPGGSAFFTSLAAASLGARVSIVSNIGNDYPARFFNSIKQKGVDVAGVKSFDGATTRFSIFYRRGLRRLRLVHPGVKLRPRNAIPIFDAIHLGPVFGEAGLDALGHARRYSKFLSVDLQGLLRRADQGGRIRLMKQSIKPYLTECDLVKATEEEIRVVVPARTSLSSARRLLGFGAKYILVTRGRAGSLLLGPDGIVRRIPSFPEIKKVDQTGAGDVFIGSWLETFTSTRDALWASAIGAAFASLALRGFGLAKFRFARRELFRRASWVYRNMKVTRA